MKFGELRKIVKQYPKADDDLELGVSIRLPYQTVGGTPVCSVKQAWRGFDWDAGKFILVPEQPLTPCSPANMKGKEAICKSCQQRFKCYSQ
jgi:hypothetical protein